MQASSASSSLHPSGSNMKNVKTPEQEPIAADLKHALTEKPVAEKAWHDLTPIGRRDFTRWIESAKQPETRQRRIRIACEKLASGQRRPCCYAVVPMDLYKALGNDPAAKAQWSSLTPDERRDCVDWVDSAEDKDDRKKRIRDGCAMLAGGKRGFDGVDA